MSAGQLYRARFAFPSTGDGVLSLSVGEQVSLISKTDANWWKVRSASGDVGLAPITYLEACPIRNGGPSRATWYKSLYDWTPQSSDQLALTKGQKLVLVDKADVSWWRMETQDGKRGLVPVNYIDKLDDQPSPAPSSSHTPVSQVNGAAAEGYQQALASIDLNISRIHEDAAKQGGTYTRDQRALLQSLVNHRQQFVSSHTSPSLSSHTHSYSLPDMSTSPVEVSPVSSPVKSQSPSHQSPSPKRHAPPPPSSALPHGSNLTQKSTEIEGVTRRKGQAGRAGPDQRYSMYVSSSRSSNDARPEGHRHSCYNSLPRRKAPPPPTAVAPVPNIPPSAVQQHTASGNSPTGPSPSSSPQRRRRSNASMTLGRQPSSPEKSRRGSGGSFQGSPQQSPRTRRRSTSTSSQRSSKKSSTSSLNASQNLSPKAPSSPTILNATPPATQSPSEQTPPNSSSTSSDTASKAKASSLEVPPPAEAVSARSSSTPTNADLLPSSFSVKEANQVVEQVRSKVAITHIKAQLAVGEVLAFLKEHAPGCTVMADALLRAIDQAQIESDTSSVSSKHKDLQRLQEIFFEVTECKDDSQQRGWAVHDDEGAIAGLLEELLQILCEANPEVSKVAIMEDKYENILTLITYYQMEPRVSIRLLLLKVFGVLCGLDQTVVGILLASVLPNELGRDIQQNLVSELQKTLYSCTVCIMIFSTAEAVPLSVYDQWDEDYVLFLMEKIEEPPSEDLEDQLPDSFVNMLLAFNQHFPDPAENLVMKALRRNSNPRNLSEKLMYLVNRGEDPVAITDPCCPDSMTKFLLDVFSDRATSDLFYTTDMMVLIDIVTRQLTDLCPGMETRTHYLELLYRIVGSTDYSDHHHRQSDLVSCLNRIASEEGSESDADKDVIKKIWKAYPNVFDEITDL